METQHIAPRVSVVLTDDERAMLRAICNADRRPPGWTLRQLVVDEAVRRGLVSRHKSDGDDLRGAVAGAGAS